MAVVIVILSKAAPFEPSYRLIIKYAEGAYDQIEKILRADFQKYFIRTDSRKKDFTEKVIIEDIITKYGNGGGIGGGMGGGDMNGGPGMRNGSGSMRTPPNMDFPDNWEEMTEEEKRTYMEENRPVGMGPGGENGEMGNPPDME